MVRPTCGLAWKRKTPAAFASHARENIEERRCLAFGMKAPAPRGLGCRSRVPGVHCTFPDALGRFRKKDWRPSPRVFSGPSGNIEFPVLRILPAISKRCEVYDGPAREGTKRSDQEHPKSLVQWHQPRVSPFSTLALLASYARRRGWAIA
jgi:hypothetical protein